MANNDRIESDPRDWSHAVPTCRHSPFARRKMCCQQITVVVHKETLATRCCHVRTPYAVPTMGVGATYQNCRDTIR